MIIVQGAFFKAVVSLMSPLESLLYDISYEFQISHANLYIQICRSTKADNFSNWEQPKDSFEQSILFQMQTQRDTFHKTMPFQIIYIIMSLYIQWKFINALNIQFYEMCPDIVYKLHSSWFSQWAFNIYNRNNHGLGKIWSGIKICIP